MFANGLMPCWPEEPHLGRQVSSIYFLSSDNHIYIHWLKFSQESNKVRLGYKTAKYCPKCKHFKHSDLCSMAPKIYPGCKHSKCSNIGEITEQNDPKWQQILSLMQTLNIADSNKMNVNASIETNDGKHYLTKIMFLDIRNRNKWHEGSIRGVVIRMI